MHSTPASIAPAVRRAIETARPRDGILSGAGAAARAPPIETDNGFGPLPMVSSGNLPLRSGGRAGGGTHYLVKFAPGSSGGTWVAAHAGMTGPEERKQDGPMQVNPQQLLDDGFIILRQVVPPEQLESLRASYETIVERQHRIWAGELDWDERVAMDYKSKQPRIVLSAVVDAATADTVEFNLHDHTLGVSRQLMQAPEAALVGMFFMCNPATDHGPDPWHRDVVPDRLAPLRGLQAGHAGQRAGLRPVEHPPLRR